MTRRTRASNQYKRSLPPKRPTPAEVRTRRAARAALLRPDPPQPISEEEHIALAFAPDGDAAWEWAFPNPEHRTEWRQRLPTLNALQTLGWSKDFTIVGAAEWVQHGATPDDARRWRPTEARAFDVWSLGWLNTSPDDTYRPWENIGLDVFQARCWHTAGITNPADAAVFESLECPADFDGLTSWSEYLQIEVEQRLSRNWTVSGLTAHVRSHHAMPGRNVTPPPPV